jgi:hypothetical protein
MASRHRLQARIAAVVVISALVAANAATDAGATMRVHTEMPRPTSSFATRFAGTPRPVGSTARGGGDVSFPDPAGVLIGRGVAQLYATGGRRSWGIATTTWRLGASGVGHVTDALSTVPPPRDAVGAWTPCNDWAPTVARLDGHYVMWFSAQIAREAGHNCDSHLRAPAHCLVYATSASPKRGFTVKAKFCALDFATATTNRGASVASQGLFDPTLFKDPVNKRVYLVWSQETFARAISNCAPRHDLAPSMLVGMAVSAQGSLHYAGRPLDDRVVLTSSDARTSLDRAGDDSFGTDCEIENPQLVLDPADARSGAPGYLLVASLGTWDEPYAYHSFAVVCSSPLGGCESERSSSVILDHYLDRSGSARLENTGGLSVVSGTRTGPVYVLFAATRTGYGPRSCYWESADFVQ